MQQAKEKVALGSIAASGGLTLAKGVVGVLTGSLAVLSEAAHSLIDFGATVMTYLAVRISGKPADEEHHYGHGKVESVSALAETALLFVLSGVVIWEAVKRLLSNQGHVVEATVAAFAVIIASVVVDFFRARLLYRVASETASEALEADALHFGSDMWSSVEVVLAVSRTLPLDRVEALKDQVAKAIRTEMPRAEVGVDAAPRALDDETVQERVMVIARNQGLAVHHVTVHDIHGKRSVSLDLEVDRKLALGSAHDIADKLEAALREELGPAVDVETHIEQLQPPEAAGREAPPERVRAVEMALAEIAAESGMIRDVHHGRVRETDEGEIVNFHGRADPALAVQAGHEKVDEVERALRRRSPSIKPVIGHAEPRR